MNNTCENKLSAKEAKARIKINNLLEQSGWRFFDNTEGKANIALEPKVKLTKAAIDALGENFEDTSNGFIDFLLMDEAGFPLVVLEAKSEDKNPLIGKEQARNYAKSQNCRFVFMSGLGYQFARRSYRIPVDQGDLRRFRRYLQA